MQLPGRRETRTYREPTLDVGYKTRTSLIDPIMTWDHNGIMTKIVLCANNTFTNNFFVMIPEQLTFTHVGYSCHK